MKHIIALASISGSMNRFYLKKNDHTERFSSIFSEEKQLLDGASGQTAGKHQSEECKVKLKMITS